MKELLFAAAQLPTFILVILLLIEISLIALFLQLMSDDPKTKKKMIKGGTVAGFSQEEARTFLQIVEKRLNELNSRCDLFEKKILQLESKHAGKEASSPALLESKVNELQKLVFSIVEKIKEYK